MKKLLFWALLLVSAITCQAAKKASPIANVQSVNFYGVDYSKCHTFGIEGDAKEIAKTLANINDLFVNESKKYDVTKFTKKKVAVIDINVGKTLSEGINADELATNSTSNKVSDEDVANTVKNLTLNETSGTGLILVGEYLSKQKAEGTYQVVFFDIASRNIVAKWQATGKAGGFGLRNFWAKSVYLVMDAIKTYKE